MTRLDWKGIDFTSADVVAINAKLMYCFPVSISDYILCIAWV